MSDEVSRDVTGILYALEQGDPDAVNQLLPAVYGEFRALARGFLSRENRGHTLQPTALVHEAYMRLVDQTRVHWQGRAHFMAAGAQAMRRVLVDHARRKQRDKRGGGRERIGLSEDLAVSPERDEDLLAVDEALLKLAEQDERQARIVELRFFGGLSVAEVAEVLQVSKRTVEADWTHVKAWLRRELGADGPT